jgi:hypothetical protein
MDIHAKLVDLPSRSVFPVLLTIEGARISKIQTASDGTNLPYLMPGFIDTNIIGNVDAGSNMTGKERLQSAGVEVSPVSIIGPAAWEAIHGEKVHTPVNKMAKQLAFSARWFPNRLRKQLGLLGGLGDVVQTKP